jgi:hypothetical protein
MVASFAAALSLAVGPLFTSSCPEPCARATLDPNAPMNNAHTMGKNHDKRLDTLLAKDKQRDFVI